MRTVLATCFVSRLAVIAVLAAGLPFARPAAAQGVGVQASGGEPQVIIASEFKTIKDTTKEVQTTEEPTKPWSVYTNVGYTSEYNFRGTNLTPDADGAIFPQQTSAIQANMAA